MENPLCYTGGNIECTLLHFQIGILIPLVFFEVCWWLLAVRWDYFSLFPSRYILSITMIFGATVAGRGTCTYDVHIWYTQSIL